MKINKIIEISKFVILNNIDNNIFKEFDFKPYQELIKYHSLNSIIIEFSRQIKLENQNQLRVNTLEHLFSLSQYENILKLFAKNNLKVLPYKGFNFQQTLYEGRIIRDIGDIDILAKPGLEVDCIELLLDNNFIYVENEIKLGDYTNRELAVMFISSKGMQEVNLEKQFGVNKCNIDFHWRLTNGFLPYQIDINLLFLNTELTRIGKYDIQMPNAFAQLIMLLTHHGAREMWLKIKYLVDLFQFLKTRGQMVNWPEFLLQLEKMKMKKVSLMGFHLVNDLFEMKLPIEIDAEIKKLDFEPTKKLIFEYWNGCIDHLTIKGRLKFERIFISLQEKDFSILKYYYGIYKYYSIPNLIERPRIFTFPSNYYFFNFLSKLITYIYKRARKNIIR